MGDYIPDITERFPEGFGGVDMTSSYYPSRKTYDEEFLSDAMLIGYGDLPDEVEQKGVKMFNVIGTERKTKRKIIIESHLTEAKAVWICECWGWMYDDGKDTYYMGIEEEEE